MGDKTKIGNARKQRRIAKATKNLRARLTFEHPYHIDAKHKKQSCPLCTE